MYLSLCNILQMDGWTCPNSLHTTLFVFVSVLFLLLVSNSRNQTYKLSFIIRRHNLKNISWCVSASAHLAIPFIHWFYCFWTIISSSSRCCRLFDCIYHIIFGSLIHRSIRPLTPCNSIVCVLCACAYECHSFDWFWIGNWLKLAERVHRTIWKCFKWKDRRKKMSTKIKSF